MHGADGQFPTEPNSTIQRESGTEKFQMPTRAKVVGSLKTQTTRRTVDQKANDNKVDKEEHEHSVPSSNRGPDRDPKSNFVTLPKAALKEVNYPEPTQISARPVNKWTDTDIQAWDHIVNEANQIYCCYTRLTGKAASLMQPWMSTYEDTSEFTIWNFFLLRELVRLVPVASLPFPEQFAWITGPKCTDQEGSLSDTIDQRHSRTHLQSHVVHQARCHCGVPQALDRGSESSSGIGDCVSSDSPSRC